MTKKKFNKLFAHYVKYFEATEEPTILHEIVTTGELHIDIVHIKPSQKYPFQVLATIGASDYKMPDYNRSLSPYNEYVTFVPADWDLTDPKHSWIIHWLIGIARYPQENKTSLSFCHTVDMTADAEEMFSDDFNMTAVQLFFPQAVDDTGILRCQTGLFEKVTILHMMPITRKELDTVKAKSIDILMDRFYNYEEGNLDFVTASYRK